MSAVPQIQLANLGMADSLILMVLALVVFGPRRLPQIGRQIGKLMYEFRKASNDFKFQMEEELRVAEDADRRKKEEAERAQRAAALPPPTETITEHNKETPVDEQAAVSAPPAFLPAPEAEPASQATPPRVAPVLQPPSTGEQVARPRAAAESNGAAPEPSSPAPEVAANVGAAEPGPPEPSAPSDPSSTEPVSQHG